MTIKKNKSSILKNFILLALFTLVSSCRTQTMPQFNQDQAYSYLVKQCEFGPRNPGSDGREKCRKYLIAELQQSTDVVNQQHFSYTFGSPPQSAKATNIIAHFQPQMKNRILLGAHWDTRPWADEDPDIVVHNQPIIGANDGASGVAVLLEISRILKNHAPQTGVDIVLFDAEDSGNHSSMMSWAIGSQMFAKERPFSILPQMGIILDLIGDSDLQIYIERFSQQYAPDVVDLVWSKAEKLGISEFIRIPKFEVFDDHIALLKIGIPCIDVIDFDYPYWHTLKDTPDKCSAESLGKVGNVVLSVLFE